MKKLISIWILLVFVISILSGIIIPVSSESAASNENNDSEKTARSREWSSYTAYYNESFNIDKSWNPDNLAMAVFLQTDDQKSRAKDSQGSSGNFNSAPVFQSTIDFLDGKTTKTGTSRNVLGELFTATWCQFCPGGVGAFDRITRDKSFFPSKTTMIALHGSGDHGNPDGAARGNWYNFGGIPTAIFDGFECYTGGNANPNSSTPESHYTRIINSRLTKTSIVDITTFGTKSNSSGWINASVELLSPTPLRNLKVRFYLLEDIYPANNTGAYYRYTVQKILSNRDFNPPNHQPKIKNQLSNIEILEDGSDSTSIQLAPGFEDEDLDVLTYSSNRDGGLKQNIKVEIDADGNVTFTPDENWNGAEDITFYADDGIDDPVDQTITVTITNVNDPPTLENPMVDFTMYEDIKIEKKINLSHVFNDIDLDPNLNAIPQQPLKYKYSGDKNIDVEIIDSWVNFDPKPDWNGNETITFTAEDPHSLKVSDNVRIWVRSDNDPPVLQKQIPDASLDEDGVLEEFIDLNDYYFDQDGDVLTYTIIEPEDIDARLSYKGESVFVSLYPAKNYWGSDTIIIQATDIPGSDPVNATIKVTVNSVNDAPILNSTNEWSIISSSVDVSESTIKVLEDNTITIYVTAYDPADKDTITFSDDTELFDIDSNTGEISFTPTNDDVGEYEVEITVNDGQTSDNQVSSKFTFIVENVNDQPEIPQIKSPIDGNTYITDTEISFMGSSDDPDLQLKGTDEYLSYEWKTNKSNDILSYDSDFETKLKPGVYQITLTVSDKDGLQNSNEISITVDINRILDTDNDGTPNYQDLDDDGDGIPDDWELKYPNILDPLVSADATEDPDNDGYSNLKEYLGDDGKDGGSDSTNPERKNSKPEEKGTSGGDKESDSSSSLLIIALLGIIIVVILLVLLFVFVRSKKKKESDEAARKQRQQMMPPSAGPPIQQPPMPMEMQMPMQMPLPPPQQQQMMQEPAYYQYPPGQAPVPGQAPTQEAAIPTPTPTQPELTTQTQPTETAPSPSGLPRSTQPQPLLEPPQVQPTTTTTTKSVQQPNEESGS